MRFQTLDARWGYVDSDSGERRDRPRQRGSGHALCGPVAIHASKAGMVLEIHVNKIEPSTIGWTTAGGWTSWQNDATRLSDVEQVNLVWDLDAHTGTAKTTIGENTYTVQMRPFMGVMGVAPSDAGQHSTIPPRNVGGNIDCKELVVGSSLYLPIAVDGALFSTGDGHAAQGDGEVAGVAIECPVEVVDLTFTLHENLHLKMPRAHTPTGWITFGFDEDLNQATAQALDGMLDLLCELHDINRTEAMALAAAVVDLRVTQVVNSSKGVHAFLPHSAVHVKRL